MKRFPLRHEEDSFAASGMAWEELRESAGWRDAGKRGLRRGMAGRPERGTRQGLASAGDARPVNYRPKVPVSVALPRLLALTM